MYFEWESPPSSKRFRTMDVASSLSRSWESARSFSAIQLSYDLPSEGNARLVVFTHADVNIAKAIVHIGLVRIVQKAYRLDLLETGQSSCCGIIWLNIRFGPMSCREKK